MTEPAQNLTSQLYEAWNKAVVDGKLVNEFEAAADDAEGRWVAGDAIAFGVKCSATQNIYYAQNLSQSREIAGAVEEKQIGKRGFICQFNGYRALRPGGAPKPLGKQPDISSAPEHCRFSCQDSRDSLSLRVREPLLQTTLPHFTWSAYYNAAPIDPDGHFLWVPDATLTHYPQALSLEFLIDALSLYRQLDHTLLFFNSLHAGASVNHIHFQAMRYHQPLPVEHWPLSEVEHERYALLKDYPARVMVFSQDSPPQVVFSWIDWLQQQQIPFNLMLIGDSKASSQAARILLIPRNIEHEIVAEFSGNGIAALGLCGKIVTVDRQAYLRADEQMIRQAFAKMVFTKMPAGGKTAP